MKNGINHITTFFSLLLAGFMLFLTLPAHSQFTGIPDPSLVVQQERERIHQRFEEIKENNKYTDYLDLGQTIEFPIGISKEIGGLEYIIAIDSVVITPHYAFLNASMRFLPPGSDEYITFRGTDFRFTQQGGISGVARLELVGDYQIKTPSGKMDLILKGEDTFVEWDCDGFSSFQLGGGVVFSREIMIPIDEAYQPIPEAQVIADFNVNIGDWNDLVAGARITPFQIPNLDGFSFIIGELMIDFSDLRNPTGATFSHNYRSRYMIPGLDELWRGAYLNGLEVILPSQFDDQDKKSRITASRLWVDEYGLSGTIRGEYIISMETGGASMSGWPFSLDEFEISLTANHLDYSFFNGQVLLPIADDESRLDYSAFIDDKNDYFFSIIPSDSLKFDLWKADVEIYESSYLSVSVEDGKFRPTAVLNGKMDISTDVPELPDLPKFTLPDLSFEQLELVDKAPFVTSGIFSPESISELPQLGTFNMDIERIGLKSINDQQVALDIGASIMLTGQKGGAFSAQGGMEIIGNVKTEDDRKKISLNSVRVKEASLKIDNGAYRFDGKINHYLANATYGSGFRGLIDAEFKPGIKVRAEAQFGRIDGYNYWFADALASFRPALQVGPGFGIFGFAGGASYHMQRQISNVYSNFPSGVNYLPDQDSGLNIRAAVDLGSLPDQNAFTGMASFELSFFNNGGLRNLNFKGEATFMSPDILENSTDILKERASEIARYESNQEQPEDLFRMPVLQNEAQINGDININYDFANRILHGNLQVFVNTPGGLIQGVGQDGRAGWAIMHFEPADWYVHIGTPEDRIGLRMGIGKIAAVTNAYFMAGRNLPPPPALNENVSRILGGMEFNYMRDEGALASGRGYALGASFEFDTGDLEFWKFYGRFNTGVGFDLMLKDYGTDVSCGGSNDGFGLNGWYANGQAYGYFEGKIGIYVDLFSERQKFDIINLSAAAVLQAKLPNPFWMRGVVGGKFDVLNGLVTGDCRFEVTIGEECDLSNASAVSGLTVIADISPEPETKDVGVFTNPQVVFNLPINKEFELIDPDNVKKLFRIKLDHFRIRGEDGAIDGDFEWNSSGDVLLFLSHEILPPYTSLNADVQISYEQLSGGSWRPVTRNGNKIIERKETKFTTGEAPDFIPKENVAFSYPTPGMKTYFPSESDKGYIQLLKGQAYLFDDVANLVGQMNEETGQVEFNYEYNQTERLITYKLPVLSTASEYNFRLVKEGSREEDAIDANVSSRSSSLEGSADVNIVTKEAEGVIEGPNHVVLFEHNFTTSQYNNFNEKMGAIEFDYTFRDQLVDWDVHRIESGFTMIEDHSEEDLFGSRYTGGEPLIRKIALKQNDYLIRKIQPLLYDNYPIDGIAKITGRTVDDLGLIPVRAVKLNNHKLQYDLPVIYQRDFIELRNKVIPMYISTPDPLPSQVKRLMFYGLPIVGEGIYKVKLDYVLPGRTESNSSIILDINLDFKN